MRRSRYPLRLQPSLMEEARKAAESQGVALNQLFNVAVAEKLAILRTEKQVHERMGPADRAATPQIPDQAGTANPAMKSDELRPDRVQDPETPVKLFGWATPQFGKLKKHLDKVNRTWRQS